MSEDVVDEVSMRKGQTYRIVVSDLERRRPIRFGGVPTGVPVPPIRAALEIVSRSPASWPPPPLSAATGSE